MLFAVHVVNSTVDWYEQGEGIPGYDECCPRSDQGLTKTTKTIT